MSIEEEIYQQTDPVDESEGYMESVDPNDENQGYHNFLHEMSIYHYSQFPGLIYQIPLQNEPQAVQFQDQSQDQYEKNIPQCSKDGKYSQKSAGNKLYQIKRRTRQCHLKNYQVYEFCSLFEDINFPIGRNIFETFNLFKQQLINQPFLECQKCYYKIYLVEISLTLIKYYFIIIDDRFQEDVLCKNQIKPIDFLKDLLIILNQNENEYMDLLTIVLQFLKGQEIQHVQHNVKRWKNLAMKFKKQQFINKSFYKCHNCNYRNFIVENNYRRKKMDEKWFYMRDNQLIKGQKQVPQSIAGKKHFVNLMLREQEKQQYGIKSNIGFFTLIVLFNQVKQNEKANSLIYADDIFNEYNKTFTQKTKIYKLSFLKSNFLHFQYTITFYFLTVSYIYTFYHNHFLLHFHYLSYKFIFSYTFKNVSNLLIFQQQLFQDQFLNQFTRKRYQINYQNQK
ncbi:hypothetical protein pb186bvf_002717 [Paramecium bursaria]